MTIFHKLTICISLCFFQWYQNSTINIQNNGILTVTFLCDPGYNVICHLTWIILVVTPLCHLYYNRNAEVQGAGLEFFCVSFHTKVINIKYIAVVRYICLSHGLFEAVTLKCQKKRWKGPNPLQILEFNYPCKPSAF